MTTQVKGQHAKFFKVIWVEEDGREVEYYNSKRNVSDKLKAGTDEQGIMLYVLFENYARYQAEKLHYGIEKLAKIATGTFDEESQIDYAQHYDCWGVMENCRKDYLKDQYEQLLEQGYFTRKDDVAQYTVPCLSKNAIKYLDSHNFIFQLAR